LNDIKGTVDEFLRHEIGGRLLSAKCGLMLEIMGGNALPLEKGSYNYCTMVDKQNLYLYIIFVKNGF
jgi:hypothetical protein